MMAAVVVMGPHAAAALAAGLALTGLACRAAVHTYAHKHARTHTRAPQGCTERAVASMDSELLTPLLRLCCAAVQHLPAVLAMPGTLDALLGLTQVRPHLMLN